MMSELWTDFWNIDLIWTNQKAIHFIFIGRSGDTGLNKTFTMVLTEQSVLEVVMQRIIKDNLF